MEALSAEELKAAYLAEKEGFDFAHSRLILEREHKEELLSLLILTSLEPTHPTREVHCDLVLFQVRGGHSSVFFASLAMHHGQTGCFW